MNNEWQIEGRMKKLFLQELKKGKEKSNKKIDGLPDQRFYRSFAEASKQLNQPHQKAIYYFNISHFASQYSIFITFTYKVKLLTAKQ